MEFAEIKPEVLNTPPESTRNQALAYLADWWGDRLVARSTEITALDIFQDIAPSVYIHGWVALVTHHCTSELAKGLIRQLRGVIGRPGLYSVSCGIDAVNQIHHAHGKAALGFGNPYDGLTHVYLHPVNPDINEECRMYEMTGRPSALSAFHSHGIQSHDYYANYIRSYLESPWEGLTADLVYNPQYLYEMLIQTNLINELHIDASDPNWVYIPRRLEDEYRIGTI